VINSKSILGRYLFRIVTGVSSVVFVGALTIIVPRYLGPEAYGSIELLVSTISIIYTFLLLQAPQGFSYWVSMKSDHKSLRMAGVLMIGIYFATVSMLILIIIVLTSYLNVSEMLWPNINTECILLSATLVMLTNLFSLITSYYDAIGESIKIDKYKIALNILKIVALLLVLFLVGLDERSYLSSQAFSVIVVIVLCTGAHNYNNLFRFFNAALKVDKKVYKDIALFISTYCKPLIVMMVFASVSNYFDRWFLQVESGSLEQAYYAISEKTLYIASFITASMVAIMNREFAIAHESKDVERSKALFKKIRIVYSIVCVVISFISINSLDIVYIIGGGEYINAASCLSVYAFYPLHQTFGQLSAGYMIATGNGRLYSLVGILGIIVSFPMGIYLIGNNESVTYAANLGALGYAIKVVVLQLIVTNVQLYFNLKKINESYLEWVLFQIVVVSLTYLAAAGSAAIIGSGLQSNLDSINIISVLVQNFFLYAFILGALYVFAPKRCIDRLIF
jgi:O-antigen/teichoic acid export membrane protein